MKYSNSLYLSGWLWFFLFSKSYLSTGSLIINSLSSAVALNPVPIFSIYAWNSNYSVKNATLVDLFKEKSLFNFCSLNNEYTVEGVKPLLDSYSDQYGFNISSNWVAYVRIGFDIIKECKPQTNFAKIVLHTSALYLTGYLQNMNAKGFVGSTIGKYPAACFLKWDNIDPVEGTVLGQKISIFSSSIYMGNSLDIEHYLSSSLPFTVDIEGDVNPLDVNVQPYSVNRILSGFFILISFLAILQSIETYYKYVKFRKKYLSFDYYTLSIIATFISNILKVLFFIDPVGNFRIFNVILARILFTIPMDFTIISLLSTIFSWYDGLKI